MQRSAVDRDTAAAPPPWWRAPLGRKIAVLLACKALAILLMFVLFFGPAQRPAVTDATVADHVLAPMPRR